jgi:hypothetical protein
MYYKLNDNELEKMYKASSITMTDYELIGNFAPVERLINVIEDLLIEVDKLEEEIEMIEKDRDENYIRMPVAEQCEVYDKDFI